ncbi:HK97-gp10 family putative phage morphogenesis protein [Clostridium botulinum]|uniref:HK97-gp10 family putative phage morphogenesis protein n=1 Tax=Clostridium botulinum TaxID=1491 RepID=UPI000773974C|nr:HK97-gp10 family putative phage morphogenesis protein [Clostridium botulinum]NFL36786.1 HK97 gp10 family phage protein [Clostridium botulinum]NFL64534.1 HK97 gp10 family phage protein [Clostridium botulinum]NFN06660.1 HK97 gp10 family phage protein [Clostridium botulinum]NFN23524.1 HK97 gp10 family phage protein [Clostridium botulinum]NFN30190.1 HK97 gp10 family phage protein [Clostridium botulinum]
MASIEVQGVDELLNKLQSIGANVGKLENKALKNAAEPVLQDAKANVPIKTGKLKKGLKITNVKRKEGSKYILVGVDRGDNSEIFYGKFIEFGTSKMSAKPFLQPAYEKNKDNIKRTIAETLKEGLK